MKQTVTEDSFIRSAHPTGGNCLATACYYSSHGLRIGQSEYGATTIVEVNMGNVRLKVGVGAEYQA